MVRWCMTPVLENHDPRFAMSCLNKRNCIALRLTSGITAGGVLELRPPGGVSPLKLINFV